MKDSIVKDKSKEFALRIIKLYKYLTTTAVNKEYVLSKQALRSGTSIGANINDNRELIKILTMIVKYTE